MPEEVTGGAERAHLLLHDNNNNIVKDILFESLMFMVNMLRDHFDLQESWGNWGAIKFDSTALEIPERDSAFIWASH